MKINNFIKIIEDKEPITEKVIDFMLDHIGDPNPVVRDELIYSTWCVLLEKLRLNLNQKQRILNKVLEEKYLLDGLTGKINHSVLKRSFTALLLAALLEDSGKTKWMTIKEEQNIIDEAFLWLASEQDYRGFDENLGWIHAFAHGADLLVEIVKLDSCGNEQVKTVMNIIRRIILDQEILLWGEEDRLNLVLIQLLKLNKLDSEDLKDWCENLAESISSWKARKKWSTFLQSLFFKIRFEKLPAEDVSSYIESYLFQAYQDSHGVL